MNKSSRKNHPLINVLQLLLISMAIVAIAGCSNAKTKENQRNIEDILSAFHQPANENVLIAAHRSMHKRYPENSLAAIRDAIDHGIDIVEVDVRTTSDGVMVLMHDGTIDRTTDGSGKVSDYMFKNLQQFKLKTKHRDTLVHRIPTLEQALNLARNRIMVDLDIKSTYVRPLVEMVRHTGTAKQVIFFDSDFGVLDSVLLLDSSLLIMPRAHDTTELHKVLRRYDPPVIHIDDSFFTPEVVHAIKNEGALIWINALGVPDILASTGIMNGYRKLINGGANIIQTDNPVVLNHYLNKRALRKNNIQ